VRAEILLSQLVYFLPRSAMLENLDLSPPSLQLARRRPYPVPQAKAMSISE
jgi:hypothetical protein